MKSDFYELAKKVVKRKCVDLHLPSGKLFVCKARDYYIAYVKLSSSMIPIGILESSKKEKKAHTRVEVHPFDSSEIEKAANNICLCGTKNASCAMQVKNKSAKTNRKNKKVKKSKK